jgi:crotonobetainyl-CoA:carnitine CoA-transferase CaiB-like acyl-CoA transferase
MRVLDLSRLLPGPYCTRILADYGAEVIKIEQPGTGDWVRQVPPLDPESGESLLFRALNRGKKSLTLNLKTEEGQQILQRLAERADVLVESYRPGVMERLGVGYGVLSKVNAGLVYCSLSGYGQKGSHRDRAGHDLNYQALSGMAALTFRAEQPPALPGVPMADLAGALWAAVGILLALLQREQTGRGQRVDTSLLAGALSCLPVALACHQGGERYGQGTNDLTGKRVCYNLYQSRDGGYMALSALEPRFWLNFCQAVGRDDLVPHHRALAVPGEWAFDELSALFRTRSREEWRQCFDGIDACCDPVYGLAEALDSAPVQALALLGEAGLRTPLHLSDRGQAQALTAPALGGDSFSLLAELGYSRREIGALESRGVV